MYSYLFIYIYLHVGRPTNYKLTQSDDRVGPPPQQEKKNKKQKNNTTQHVVTRYIINIWGQNVLFAK